MTMTGRLHWRLTGIFCSAVLLGLLLGYFSLTAHLQTFLDQDLQNKLKRDVLITKSFIEEQIRTRSMEDPHTIAKRVGREAGLRVTVFSAEGDVLGDSELSKVELTRLENHSNRPEIREALRTGSGMSRRYSHTLKKDLLHIAVSFGQDRSKGVLRFALPISDVELFASGADKVVLVTLLFVFVLSLGFTYFMSVVVSRPLREMAVIAKAMADGDFSRIPSVRSQDEVGNLAEAITYMSQQIRGKIEDIEGEKAKLDAVLATMFEGIMVVDEKGTIIVMNPSLRKIFFIDTPPEGRRAVEVIRNRHVTEMTEKLLKGEEKFISQDVFIGFPEERLLKVNGVVIRTSEKREGAVFVFHDITELRRLEKVRQDFVANVSHELRTPVSSIKGYAETLLQGAMEDKETLKEFLNTIYQNSDRLVILINDLLDLARIQSGKMNIVTTAVDAELVIRRCLGVLGKTISNKGLTISVDIPQKGIKVLADEARLAQVVLNLLDNAVKYTPENGSIVIRAMTGDKLVQFDVIDTGIGIPEEDLPRIFERFYRVDKARSRDQGGTGLGLSIVKHIVQAHGGDVWVSSVLNQGTTFSFTFSVL